MENNFVQEEKMKFFIRILVRLLIAITVSIFVVGCDEGTGTPPSPDSNITTGGGDDNSTGGSEVHPNISLTIQKSDLGDCPDMKVQIWAEKKVGEADPTLYGVWEYDESNITENDTNYTVALPENSIPDHFYHSHATVYCGEREWGMKTISYDMDDISGFHKAPFSLVMMFVKTYPKYNNPDFPDELAPSYDTRRVVLGVASSKSMYADSENNSSDSIDIVFGIQEGFEVGESNYLYGNLDSDMFHFDRDSDWEFSGFGYIDSGTSRNFGSFNGKWYASKIRLFNNQETYSDIVFKAKGEQYMNWGQERYPSWMQ